MASPLPALDSTIVSTDPTHQPDAAQYLRDVVRSTVPDVQRPA